MKRIIFIKVLVLPFLITTWSCQREVITVQVVIDRCAEAMGGYDIIDSIEVLHIKAIYPDHGNVPMELIIKRPNKNFNPRSKAVFDGERVCFLDGMDYLSGPELSPEEDWKDSEVEIGCYFPAIFEYPSVLIGKIVENSTEFYKLRVILPLGATIYYLVDSEHYLISKVEFSFIMGDKEINDWRDWGDYRYINGLYYPHIFTYNSRNGRETGRMDTIMINPPIGDELFNIPDSI